MSEIVIRRCTEEESRYSDEIVEKWERVTDENDEEVLLVGAWRPPGDSWRVTTVVSRYLSPDDMEYELIDAVEQSLMRVPGVERVLEEDRGQWIVLGEPSGYELAFAASSAVDQRADKLRSVLKGHRSAPG
jgi:hypothetical protein